MTAEVREERYGQLESPGKAEDEVEWEDPLEMVVVPESEWGR